MNFENIFIASIVIAVIASSAYLYNREKKGDPLVISREPLSTQKGKLQFALGIVGFLFFIGVICTATLLRGGSTAVSVTETIIIIILVVALILYLNIKGKR